MGCKIKHIPRTEVFQMEENSDRVPKCPDKRRFKIKELQKVSRQHMSRKETPRRTNGKKEKKRTLVTAQTIYLFYTSEHRPAHSMTSSLCLLARENTLPLQLARQLPLIVHHVSYSSLIFSHFFPIVSLSRSQEFWLFLRNSVGAEEPNSMCSAKSDDFSLFTYNKLLE